MVHIINTSRAIEMQLVHFHLSLDTPPQCKCRSFTYLSLLLNFFVIIENYDASLLKMLLIELLLTAGRSGGVPPYVAEVVVGRRLELTVATADNDRIARTLFVIS